MRQTRARTGIVTAIAAITVGLGTGTALAASPVGADSVPIASAAKAGGPEDGALDPHGKVSDAGASAEPKGFKACPKGFLCVWSKQNYAGKMQMVRVNHKDLSLYTVFSKGYHSIYNHHECTLKGFLKKNYKGKSGTNSSGWKASGPYKKHILSVKFINCP